MEWERIFFNNSSVDFLLEVVLRSVMMFFVLLVILKLAGKRGIKQLSIFELIIIISLGSAAGDPMFYEDVGIVHGIVALVVVLVLYRGITWLAGRIPTFEKFMEGKPQCLLRKGTLDTKTLAKESLGEDELFSELRLRNIQHLGQVEHVYLETSGEISVFYFDDKDVIPGLPILPEVLNNPCARITVRDIYCCCRCGAVHELDPGEHCCAHCQGSKWVRAIQTKRIP